MQGRSENRQGRPKGLISAEAKLNICEWHNIIAYFYKYDWLCHLATFIYVYEKGGHMTKPIIFVKICCVI